MNSFPHFDEVLHTYLPPDLNRPLHTLHTLEISGTAIQSQNVEWTVFNLRQVEYFEVVSSLLLFYVHEAFREQNFVPSAIWLVRKIDGRERQEAAKLLITCAASAGPLPPGPYRPMSTTYLASPNLGSGARMLKIVLT